MLRIAAMRLCTLDIHTRDRAGIKVDAFARAAAAGSVFAYEEDSGTGPLGEQDYVTWLGGAGGSSCVGDMYCRRRARTRPTWVFQ